MRSCEFVVREELNAHAAAYRLYSNMQLLTAGDMHMHLTGVASLPDVTYAVVNCTRTLSSSALPTSPYTVRPVNSLVIATQLRLPVHNNCSDTISLFCIAFPDPIVTKDIVATTFTCSSLALHGPNFLSESRGDGDRQSASEIHELRSAPEALVGQLRRVM